MTKEQVNKKELQDGSYLLIFRTDSTIILSYRRKLHPPRYIAIPSNFSCIPWKNWLFKQFIRIISNKHVIKEIVEWLNLSL